MNKIKSLLGLPHIQRFVKSASWSLIGTVSGKILMLVAFIIVARIIGKEEYGKIGVLRSTITMFMVFSSMGMGLTAARYVAYYRNSNREKAYQIHRASNQVALIFGMIISAIVFLFNNIISQTSFGTTELSFSLRLCIIALFFTTISSAQSGTLTGFEDFKRLGINNLVYGIVQFLFIILGALVWGADGVIVSLGISAGVFVILNQISIKKHFGPTLYNTKIFTSEIKNIFIKFSLPAMLSTFVAMPVIWLGKALLVRTNGFGEMAIFDVSEQWYLMVLFIPNSIGSIILPMLSNTLSEDSGSQYKKLLKLNLLVNCGVVIILTLFIILLAPFILKLYGSNFTSYLPLRVLLLAAILQTVNSVLGQVIASKAKMWLGFGVNLFWGMSFLIIAYIFIEYLNLGALGLSYAFLLSYLLHSILQGFITFKITI
ncbi:oligosaccharide flippase family protein [Chryseobacterium oryctis]|uniref:Oligosaccharide flippase family protein n=1 Tax=Chryseobacterium oryctis TaxID=2952618 RepID=A0ABT3HJ97_9FLAO|nr:oligosaccharide flippase family protein [Chryseobacterium oryctis]MCW3159873.1 oligosaccharide flippase family protein [Chryseobacterium oryctis]